MKKTRVTAIRPAGPDHQVVTVAGGSGKSYRRKPCDTCPWRIDAIGEFPAEAFRHSANTAYDVAMHVFACHSSGATKPAVCAGFILNGSTHNLGMRLKISAGEIDPHEVSDGGVELFDSYRAMAEANGVDRNDPILRPCRQPTNRLLSE